MDVDFFSFLSRKEKKDLDYFFLSILKSTRNEKWITKVVFIEIEIQFKISSCTHKFAKFTSIFH